MRAATVIKALGCAIVIAIAIAGCSEPLSRALAPPRVIDREPRPDDPRVAFDVIELGPDKRSVLLQFIGGKPFDPANPNDPCWTDYVAVGEMRDDVLEVAVIETVSMGEGLPNQPADGGPTILCTLGGHPRTAKVDLPAPFLGSTVHDLAGNVRFLSAPDGLVELAGLPAGWTLRAENDLGGSPTGRWQRRYAPSDEPPGDGTLGALDFYQAFGGPVNVSGGEDVQSVAIGDAGGEIGTLYRHGPNGELVLTWDIDGTGLAIVANEHEFTSDALIQLAGSAILPHE